MREDPRLGTAILLAVVSAAAVLTHYLALMPLLAQVGLEPELVARVNMFNGWRLVKCVNRK